MSTFVEVTNTDKNCTVLVNLDMVSEIAPLVSGGCEIFLVPSGGVNNRVSFKVKESYEVFKQFAMQTVTSDMIKEKVAKLKGTDKQ